MTDDAQRLTNRWMVYRHGRDRGASGIRGTSGDGGGSWTWGPAVDRGTPPVSPLPSGYWTRPADVWAYD